MVRRLPSHRAKLPGALACLARCHVIWSPSAVTKLRGAPPPPGLYGSQASSARATQTAEKTPRFWCHTVASIMPTALATDVRHHQPRNPMTSMNSAWHARVWLACKSVVQAALRPLFTLSLCNSWRKDTISVPRYCQHHAHHARNRWPPSPAVPSSRKYGLGRPCKLVAEPPLFPDFPLISLTATNQCLAQTFEGSSLQPGSVRDAAHQSWACRAGPLGWSPSCACGGASRAALSSSRVGSAGFVSLVELLWPPLFPSI